MKWTNDSAEIRIFLYINVPEIGVLRYLEKSVSCGDVLC